MTVLLTLSRIGCRKWHLVPSEMVAWLFTGHGHDTLRHLARKNPMAEGHTPACHQQVEAHLFKAKRILHFEVCYGMINDRHDSPCLNRHIDPKYSWEILWPLQQMWMNQGEFSRNEQLRAKWLEATSFQAAAFPCQPSAQNITNDLMSDGNHECL